MSAPIHLETLNIFCDIVRHQSFSRGAVANSVSQSAASQAVRQLEKHLGAQLIDRSKRPWVLTPEGQGFCLYVRAKITPCFQSSPNFPFWFTRMSPKSRRIS